MPALACVFIVDKALRALYNAIEVKVGVVPKQLELG